MFILIISDWIPDFHKLYNSVSSKIKLCQIIARPMAKLKKKKNIEQLGLMHFPYYSEHSHYLGRIGKIKY